MKADNAGVPRVVLDANVLVANFRPGHGFRRLLDGSRTRQLVLLVPDLAIREATNKHYEQCEKAIRELERVLADLARLGIESSYAERTDPAASCMAYEARLRSALTEAGARVMPTAEVAHDELINRALKRRKPFDHKGAGYRDALLWETVLAEARSGTSVTFCTSDKGDFAANGTLAPDLVDDLTAAGLPASAVQLATDLTRLAKALVDVGYVATKDVEQALARSDDDLREFVGQFLHDTDLDRAQLRDVLGSPADLAPTGLVGEQLEVGDALILDLGELTEVAVEEAEVLSTGDVLASLYVKLPAEIEVEVEIAGHDARDGRPRRGGAIKSLSVTIGAEVDAVFSRPDLTLHSASFGDIYILEAR